MLCRCITTIKQLGLLSTIFSGYTGIRLSTDYLSQGFSYLFYEDEQKETEGDPVAGFALITQPPFRFLQLLPEHIKQMHRFDLDTCFEVNALFIKEKGAFKRIMSQILQLILDNTQNKKTLLLYFNADNPKLSRLWQYFLEPVKIYTGKPATDKIKTYDNIHFNLVPRENITLFLQRIASK